MKIILVICNDQVVFLDFNDFAADSTLMEFPFKRHFLAGVTDVSQSYPYVDLVLGGERLRFVEPLLC
jgi:hypothetical protein